MKYQDILKINKLYFTAEDISKALGISYCSSQVTASRYVKKGLLTRVKRGFYLPKERWDRITQEDAFLIANILEVPSYISLTTALSFYEVSTQIQRDFIESISIKRTKEHAIQESSFVFKKIKKSLYGDFKKINGYFIATPEKALLDSIYLASINRYNIDISALDMDKIDKNIIKTYIKKYPKKTLKFWRKNVGSL